MQSLGDENFKEDVMLCGSFKDGSSEFCQVSSVLKNCGRSDQWWSVPTVGGGWGADASP